MKIIINKYNYIDSLPNIALSNIANWENTDFLKSIKSQPFQTTQLVMECQDKKISQMIIKSSTF